jgi:2-oxoisovalerate dehydrogenase E1 component alpha subunit
MSAQLEPSKSERSRAKPPVKGAKASEPGLAFAAELALSQALDEAMLDWQRRGQLGSFVPAGEWAQVLAAVVAAAKPEELIFPGMREARLSVFRGLPIVDYLRQHLGLDAPGADPALSHAGHAGPGMIASAEHRIASPGGGAGAHLPQAVGAALAARTLGRPEATLALAGAAAADTDDCHVALNFAAVFRAPAVFVFRSERGDGDQSMVRRASGYAIPAEQIAGDDPAAVQRRLGELLEAARSGKGPAIVEVTQPVKRAVASAAALAQARGRVEAAFKEAQQGRRPSPAALVLGVFSELTWPLVAQARELAGEPAVSPEEV